MRTKNIYIIVMLLTIIKQLVDKAKIDDIKLLFSLISNDKINYISLIFFICLSILIVASTLFIIILVWKWFINKD